MTRVLATGGTGFVGGWCIVELLEAGYDVTATVRDEVRGPMSGGRLEMSLSGRSPVRHRERRPWQGRRLGRDGRGIEFVLHSRPRSARIGKMRP